MSDYFHVYNGVIWKERLKLATNANGCRECRDAIHCISNLYLRHVCLNGPIIVDVLFIFLYILYFYSFTYFYMSVNANYGVTSTDQNIY